VETKYGLLFSFLSSYLHICVEFSCLDFKFHISFWIVEAVLCVYKSNTLSLLRRPSIHPGESALHLDVLISS